MSGSDGEKDLCFFVTFNFGGIYYIEEPINIQVGKMSKKLNV